MNGTKPWYQSVGVLGSIGSLISWAAAIAKYELDAQLVQDLNNWILGVFGLITTAMALWGRLRASKRIVADDPDVPRQNWRSNAWLLGGLVLLVPLLGGCAGGGVNPFAAPNPHYVVADRATFEAVSPEYSAYVAADANLDAEQVARRQRTVATWRKRIEEAEKRTPSQAPDPFETPTAPPATAPVKQITPRMGASPARQMTR